MLILTENTIEMCEDWKGCNLPGDNVFVPPAVQMFYLEKDHLYRNMKGISECVEL
jgi:hypothetical protein